MLTRPPATPGTASAPGARSATLDERGFTLVELVIAVAVLGIVMAAVTGLLITSVDTNNATGERLGESTDLQFAASYFSADVASAQPRPSGPVFATGATPGCGADPASRAVIEFTGQTFDDAQPPVMRTTVTTYVLRTTASSGRPARELHRLTCSAPSSPTPGLPLTPALDLTVARLLSTSVDPVVTCLDASGATTSCTPSPSAPPVAVRLRLTSRSGNLTGTLTGHWRTP